MGTANELGNFTWEFHTRFLVKSAYQEDYERHGDVLKLTTRSTSRLTENCEIAPNDDHRVFSVVSFEDQGSFGVLFCGCPEQDLQRLPWVRPRVQSDNKPNAEPLISGIVPAMTRLLKLAGKSCSFAREEELFHTLHHERPHEAQGCGPHSHRGAHLDGSWPRYFSGHTFV